jgi:hypothetical protein
MIAKLLSGVISRRSCQSSFHFPSSTEPNLQNAFWPSEFFSPRTHALRSTLERKHSVITSVATVFLRSRPLDIPWSVVTITIYTIQLVTISRVLANFCSYLGGKDFVFSPSRVHFNPPSAVELVAVYFWVVTAFSCGLPTSIERSTSFTMPSADTSGSSISHVKEVS